jgi:hypothetical protein
MGCIVGIGKQPEIIREEIKLFFLSSLCSSDTQGTRHTSTPHTFRKNPQIFNFNGETWLKQKTAPALEFTPRTPADGNDEVVWRSIDHRILTLFMKDEI